jgi:hypothetical protein
MPENQDSPNEKNNAQNNHDNNPEKTPTNEKFSFILWSEIKEYIEKQNTRNKETSDTNQKILQELIKNRKKIYLERYGGIIQGLLTLFTLGMLVFFVISMHNQSVSTKQALDRADTANKYTST